ncbi:hypothetical protein J6590_087943 [Homalodisca vitripennis]|nr:hypothetical protein J6590_087943 [Homalodisca vitripennis]
MSSSEQQVMLVLVTQTGSDSCPILLVTLNFPLCWITLFPLSKLDVLSVLCGLEECCIEQQLMLVLVTQNGSDSCPILLARLNFPLWLGK